MTFDLGDPIPLTFTTRDATGALAPVTTAVLTITLPDGTTVTPAVSTASTGVYAPATPYISTLAGIHRVSWVGSGVNAQDYSDVFNVLPADPHFIISLAEARAAIGMSLGTTSNDERIRTVIAAATPIMEDICGPILQTPHVETFDGGSDQIELLFAPLISVTSVVEFYGSNYMRTLTPQDIFSGTAVDAFGYTVELKTGLVTRRVAGTVVPFPVGRRNVQISYVAGRATVGGNILLATGRLVRHLWMQEQQSFRPNVLAVPEPMSLTPSGFAVPNAVLEMCAGDVRGPGIA